MKKYAHMQVHEYTNTETTTIQVYKYTQKTHAEFATAETNAYTHILDTKNPDTIIHIDEYTHSGIHRLTQIRVYKYRHTDTNVHIYK